MASTLNIPDQLTFVGGVALVLVGLYLQVRLSHYAMQAEEHTKEGWLTEEQARRRITTLTICGPAAMILGLVACVVVLRT